MDVGTAVLRNAKSTVNIFGTVNLTLIYVLWVGQASWQNWPNLPPEPVVPKRKRNDAGSASKPKRRRDVLSTSEKVKILDMMEI